MDTKAVATTPNRAKKTTKWLWRVVLAYSAFRIYENVIFYPTLPNQSEMKAIELCADFIKKNPQFQHLNINRWGMQVATGNSAYYEIPVEGPPWTSNWDNSVRAKGDLVDLKKMANDDGFLIRCNKDFVGLGIPRDANPLSLGAPGYVYCIGIARPGGTTPDTLWETPGLCKLSDRIYFDGILFTYFK